MNVKVLPHVCIVMMDAAAAGRLNQLEQGWDLGCYTNRNHNQFISDKIITPRSLDGNMKDASISLATGQLHNMGDFTKISAGSANNSKREKFVQTAYSPNNPRKETGKMAKQDESQHSKGST